MESNDARMEEWSLPEPVDGRRRELGVKVNSPNGDIAREPNVTRRYNPRDPQPGQPRLTQDKGKGEFIPNGVERSQKGSKSNARAEVQGRQQATWNSADASNRRMQGPQRKWRNRKNYYGKGYQKWNK